VTDEDKIWILVARRLSGEATARDAAALSDLLQKTPALLPKLDILEQIWVSRKNASNAEQTAAIEKIMERIRKSGL